MTNSVIRDGGADPTRQRLLEAAQQGDLGAQEELVRRYEPLVQRVVWKLRLPRGCEREDLAQEARVGLLSAIRAWRPERGPFPAFADRCVTNQALLALQAACAHKHQVLSLAASRSTRHRERHGNPADDGRAPALLDTLAARRDTRTDPEESLLVHEQLTSVLRALQTLTESERAGLAMALNGQSYKRLAPTLARHAEGGITGGLPRTPQARAPPSRRPRDATTHALPLTTRRHRWHDRVTAQRSEPGRMSCDEPRRPGPDAAPPRPRRRRVGRVAEPRRGVEVDARDLDVGMAGVGVDRDPSPRAGIADALERGRGGCFVLQRVCPKPPPYRT